MRMHSFESLRLLVICNLISLALLTSRLSAQNGTWTSTIDGLWSSSGNWAGETLADGANNTADFNTLDIQDQTGATGFPAVGVQLDTPRTIGHMIFGDTNAATPGAWDLFTLDQVTNVLTLADATKPTITVNPLGPVGSPTPQDSARVLVNLAGTNGFTKLGGGVLSLGGLNASLTGTIDVNAGTLRAVAGATFDFETATTPEVLRFNLANGAEIDTAVGLGQNAAPGGGITLANGATATITNSATGNINLANVSGAGATLNLDIVAGGTTTSLDRDWAAAGTLAAVNFRGLAAGTPSLVQMRFQGGGFNVNSLITSAVNLDNATIFLRTFSSGNTVTFGSLSGTSTATLQGAINGSQATYVVGGLNTNTTFAGNMTTGNGLNLFKVGTGTLELSGTLTYQPTANAILNRRGGTTRVEAGTLKLTGPAAIPGGLIDAVQGDLISTIDIRAGATLDVSGTTTPYSTANLQQVIGAGTIVGNYTHDEGTLAPGDTNVGGNTQTLTPVPGTLTFADDLSFAGSGVISFNLDNTPAGSNDLIQVNGTANLSGTPTVTPNFSNGIPALGQTYTLLTAAGGFGGSNPSGWVVNWPGRGLGPTVFTSGNNVQITTTEVVSHSLNWSGAVDANWNTTTANWYNNNLSAAGNYVEFDNVNFADTFNGGMPVANTNVNLPGVVNPSTVTVDSTTTDYTIAGTGRIAGNASLTKRGPSTLNLTGANTYVGGTTIEGGILDLGPAGQAGTGTITLAGGALHAGEAGNFNLNNAVQVNGSGNVISNDNNGSQTLNLNGVISGSGNLALQNNSIGNGVDPPAINGIDIFGNNAGFTGTLAISGPTAVFVRFRTDGAEGTNVAWDLGNNGSVLAANVGANTVFQLGSLTGGTLSRVSGHESGGGVGSSTYEVGALGTSTTFSGAIMNGRTDVNAGNFTSLTKVGAGTLTLDNMVDPNLADTITLYSGDTRVQGGTLSIAQAYLADTADVFIASGSVLDLTTAGATDVIDSLYLGNAPQNPGTYGAIGSAATFQSSFFTGTGILQVTTLGAPIVTPGDFDGDGDVDGRDFLVWQRGGSPTPLSAADLAAWQANYGAGPLSAVSASATAVPEPGTCALVGLAAAVLSLAARRNQV